MKNSCWCASTRRHVLNRVDVTACSKNMASWSPMNHTVRMQAMAQALISPASQYYSNATFQTDALGVWDWWLQHDLQAPNW